MNLLPKSFASVSLFSICRVIPGLAVFFFVFIVATGAIAQAANADVPQECLAYTSVPLPAEAEAVPVPKTSPGCASYRSYRGIGRPLNYAEARACAWKERLAQKADLQQNPKEPLAWVVGGSLILADIYYNGAGVARNVPLAKRFACESEESVAALALEAIEKSNGARSKHPFEFCDYAGTTFMMNFCMAYSDEVDEAHRVRYYDSLKPSMTPEQRSAFEKLLAAHNVYIKAHADEVYKGGTIRNIRTMRSQDILRDLFRSELVHFEGKRFPKLSTKQIISADELMQRQYQVTLEHLRSQTAEDIREGEVTGEQFVSVQKAWESYRDAWVVFARLRYASAMNAIRAQISLDRYRLMKTI